MSLVTPIPQNTTIRIYKGVEWDSGYNDIRLFDSQQQRESYLEPLQLGWWNHCSVVTPGKTIRVQVDGQYGAFMVANYMDFYNMGMGDASRYFCFILNVRYVNVNTIEIDYVVDWIQTYLFDFQFDACYVEREHVSDDSFGKHTVDENLDTGEYLVEYIRNRVHAPAVIAYIQANTLSVSNVNQVVTCLTTQGFKMGNLGALSDLLNTFNDAPEQIVQLQMCVEEMLTSGGAGTYFIDGFEVRRDHSAFIMGGDSYTPHNNKLLCYPYKFFTIDNFNGQIQDFRWEDCTIGVGAPHCEFQLIGAPNPKPCMQCYPTSYKGWSGNDLESAAVPQFAITYDNFPQVAWNSDTFRAWVSQYGSLVGVNAASSVVNIISSAVKTGGATTALTGNAVLGTLAGASQGIGQAVQQGTQFVTEARNRQIHSKQMHGSIGNAGLDYAQQRVGFRETQYGIRPEYARKIDSYFDRYGYRVNEYKIPNIRGRQYVNYVQCQNAHVSGIVATEAREAMENALNRGVSFWHVNSIGQNFDSNPIV